MVVFHQGGLSSVWSFVRVVSHQGGLSSGWPLIRVVYHQGSFIRVVSHQGALLSGWSFIRDFTVNMVCSLFTHWEKGTSTESRNIASQMQKCMENTPQHTDMDVLSNALQTSVHISYG